MELEHSYIETNGICLHVVRPGRRAESLSSYCTAFQNFGMDRHNPQNGLVLTKRFVIFPSKITQNG